MSRFFGEIRQAGYGPDVDLEVKVWKNLVNARIDPEAEEKGASAKEGDTGR